MKELAFSVGNYQIAPPVQMQGLSQLTLRTLVPQIVNLIIFAAILLAFVFFLIGGIKWLFSQGDKKQVEEAQKTLTFAIVGLILIFLSFLIMNLISYVFQVPLIGAF